MGVKVQWDNTEKTIVRYIYEGRWTWDEFYAVQDELARMLETVNYKVDIIADMRASAGSPSGSLAHARRVLTSRHPQTGITVLMGANRFVKLLVDVVRQAYPALFEQYNVRLASSIEEAYALIAAAREQRKREEGDDSAP